MKSLERRFKKIQKADPNLGDYIVFARAIKGQRFNKMIVTRWFNKLIPKDDYLMSEKKDLIKHLMSVTNDMEKKENPNGMFFVKWSKR